MKSLILLLIKSLQFFFWILLEYEKSLKGSSVKYTQMVKRDSLIPKLILIHNHITMTRNVLERSISAFFLFYLPYLITKKK